MALAHPLAITTPSPTAEQVWDRIRTALPSPHLPIHPNGFRRTLMNVKPGGLYLEIGTRRGHSLAARLLHAGGSAFSIDCYLENYADEPNPGPAAVRDFLSSLGVSWDDYVLIGGDSHQILPLLLPNLFDVILVDGDHTQRGAQQDLRDATRLLKSDGILLFDDAIPELLAVWRETIASLPHFTCIEYPACDGAEPWCRADMHPVGRN